MILNDTIETENIEQIEMFLQHNADQISKGELASALNTSAFYGDEEIVRLLIKYGADVNFRHENNMTPLNCSIENMHLNVIRLLLENGANVNSHDDYGVTPLHQAIDIEIEESNTTTEYPPSTKVTSILLSYYPNIDAKDFNGRTPLDWAMTRKHILAIELLKAFKKR